MKNSNMQWSTNKSLSLRYLWLLSRLLHTINKFKNKTCKKRSQKCVSMQFLHTCRSLDLICKFKLTGKVYKVGQNLLRHREEYQPALKD